MTVKFNFLDRHRRPGIDRISAELRAEHPGKSDAWIRNEARQKVIERDITHELRAPVQIRNPGAPQLHAGGKQK